MTSAWDLAGRRTRLTYPGSGLYVDYDHLTTGEMTKARENGATSGVGVLATFAYDNIGRRSSLTRGNGTVTSYGFDAVSRLSTLAENMTGTGQDQSVTFSYNPASQITSLTKTNDTYAWTGHGNGSTASVANGLNQLSSIGGTATTHDARGNVTFDPMSGKTYGYASENLLTSASGGTSATLGYDSAMRLYQVSATATTRFLYDGVNLIGEYDGSNVLQKRYVFGPGIDEPLVQYDASATRSWLHADERGSIIAISDTAGTVTQINAYDEYGKPQSTNVGRFQYTGQTWLPEVGAYYYKARIYSPVFGGRFLQTDPIDVAGGINIYAYVGGDPVNATDPMGFADCPAGQYWGTPTGSHIQGCLDPSVNGGTLGVGYAPASRTFWSSIMGSAGGAIAGGGSYRYVPGPPTHYEGGEIVVTAGQWVWHADPWASNANPPAGFPMSFRTRTIGRSGAASPAFKKRLFGTHWCGVGGEGPTTSKLDEACKAHDQCYAEGGFSPYSNFNPFAGRALQQCNQRLCDASRGQGRAGTLVILYFWQVPTPGNACRP